MTKSILKDLWPNPFFEMYRRSHKFGSHFALKEFSQLESMKSGRVESEEENEITGELEGWFPDERDLQHLIES